MRTLPTGVWPEIWSGRSCGRSGFYFPIRQLHTGETSVRPLEPAEVDATGFWSHAADALLYRLSSTVRERVKVRVAKQIIDEVTKQYDTEQESLWSVIAHSLGTAVAHDALDMLATGHVPGAPVNAFDPKIEQANVIAMVANTSRLLETVVDAYESAVKPGRAGQAGRDCLRFLNFRHFLDPFTIPQMFHPQAWPDAATVSANRTSTSKSRTCIRRTCTTSITT
jgi:hypothetical protein